MTPSSHFDMFRPRVSAEPTQPGSVPHYLDTTINPSLSGLSKAALDARTAELDRRTYVYGIREAFFRDLLLAWANPPNLIDQVMGQDRSYISPDFATHRHDHPKTIKAFDIPNGVLAASVTPQVADLEKGHLRWTYSIWQAGDWLRFGVLIQGETRYLVAFDNEHDNVLGLERIWDCNADFMSRGPNGLLVEWRFKQPDFYDDFTVRERFIMVARHLHFRLSAMIDSLSRKIAAGDFDQPENPEVEQIIGAPAREFSLDGLREDGSWTIPEDEEESSRASENGQENAPDVEDR